MEKNKFNAQGNCSVLLLRYLFAEKMLAAFRLPLTQSHTMFALNNTLVVCFDHNEQKNYNKNLYTHDM